MQENEELTDALKREVLEEVGSSIAEMLPEKKKTIVYRGYVDDHRNTDNAWMETTAFALYFNQEESKMMPVALDPTDVHEVDAEKGGWFPLEPFLSEDENSAPKLFGSHGQIVRLLKDWISPQTTVTCRFRRNKKKCKANSVAVSSPRVVEKMIETRESLLARGKSFECS